MQRKITVAMFLGVGTAMLLIATAILFVQASIVKFLWNIVAEDTSLPQVGLMKSLALLLLIKFLLGTPLKSLQKVTRSSRFNFNNQLRSK